MFCETVIL